MSRTQEVNRYIHDHPNSQEEWQKAVKLFAGGINHNIRSLGLPMLGAYPPFIKNSQGARITDVDNHQYIDYWLGHYSQILGHNNPDIRTAIKERLEYGWHVGTTIPEQNILANLLVSNSKGIEKVRFCTSGTEATMYATRLARGYTRKRIIAKAKMGWHGANDTLFYDVKKLKGRETEGILSHEVAGVLTFDINDDSIFSQLKKKREEIAAVIIEPVLGGGGGFKVNEDFLKQLREVTEENDILLIFDEIITGYRYHYGLYQDLLGIQADLTTMGKIVGGGLPIGVIGGREDIINQADSQLKNYIRIGGGTFSVHPLSMVAGVKILEVLKHKKSDYRRITNLGNNLLKKLNKLFREYETTLLASGSGSMVFIHTLKEFKENLTPYQIVRLSDKKEEAFLHLFMLNRGISGMHGLGSLSFCHNDKLIDQTIDVIIKYLEFISKGN